MRQGRESGCGRGSKGSWRTWAGDVTEVLGGHVRGSVAVRGEDGADMAAPLLRERERARGTNG
jgi:hypothetical protein